MRMIANAVFEATNARWPFWGALAAVAVALAVLL